MSGCIGNIELRSHGKALGKPARFRWRRRREAMDEKGVCELVVELGGKSGHAGLVHEREREENESGDGDGALGPGTVHDGPLRIRSYKSSRPCPLSATDGCLLRSAQFLETPSRAPPITPLKNARCRRATPGTYDAAIS